MALGWLGQFLRSDMGFRSVFRAFGSFFRFSVRALEFRPRAVTITGKYHSLITEQIAVLIDDCVGSVTGKTKSLM